jgi:hypothetical protein
MNNIPQNILDNFANKGKRYESHETMGMKMWGAIVKKHQLDMGFPDIKSAATDLKARAQALDLDDPSLTTSEKAIKRLATGRFADAVKLVEDGINHRSEIEKQAVNTNASSIASQRHAPNNELIQSAIEFYKLYEGRYANKDEAAEDLAEKFPPIKESTYRRHLRGI